MNSGLSPKEENEYIKNSIRALEKQIEENDKRAQRWADNTEYSLDEIKDGQFGPKTRHALAEWLDESEEEVEVAPEHFDIFAANHYITQKHNHLVQRLFGLLKLLDPFSRMEIIKEMNKERNG